MIDGRANLPSEIPARLIAQLRQSEHLVVLTGAGISAESGVPTFQTGFWEQYNPEDLATPEGYQRNPGFVWNWYAQKRELLARIQPNPGHVALAEMEKRVPHFAVITQNIDGLHQKAGSRRVIELHGNLQRTRCWRENIVVTEWAPVAEAPPRCPHCGSWLRPDVVWFGELLPPESLAAAEAACATCDLFFSIGTSAQVYPAAALPHAALQAGAIVVEINPDETPLTPRASYSFRCPSGLFLPPLLRAAWPQ